MEGIFTLIFTFSAAALLFSLVACLLAARFAPGAHDLREIRRRLDFLERENTQLRIRLGEHDLYPTVFEMEAAEKEELSISIGSKQVFGLVKAHPRRK